MFNNKAIFWFLAGAAVVGFLLDARQKRMTSRTANNNVPTAAVIPLPEERVFLEPVG
jgi:hypothetical protein